MDHSVPHDCCDHEHSHSHSHADHEHTHSHSHDSHTEEQKPSVDVNLQEMLHSKIAELENGTSKDEEEERKIVKATKKHLQELKLAIDAIPSSEEKIRTLNSKYAQLYTDFKKQERDLQLQKRRAEQASKDKDSAVAEQNKANGMKGKLETLCRELQRQNKAVLEDSRRVAAEEQQKRQDLSKKFHTTLKEITTKMEEQGEERMKQLTDNEMLREKLKNLVEQYQVREQHYATQMKAKDLERQLLEAKLKQQADIALQEALKAQAYKEQIASLAKTEGELRNQLNIYAEKFEQFQDTLTKSNDVFASFKQEMERMTKTIKQREKENAALKKKSDQSDVTLIEMVEERNGLRKQLDTVKAQKLKLEGLCRALQAERSSSAPSSASLLPSTSDTDSSSTAPNSTSPNVSASTQDSSNNPPADTSVSPPVESAS